MVGRVLVGIVSLFLLLAAFSSPIIEGIHNWRTNDTTQAFSAVVTTATPTADVVLSHDLFQAATGEVVSISSNMTETPVATSYVEATKTLTISDLALASTRTLTVRYYAETDDSTMRVLGPFLVILILGACIAAVIYSMWTKPKRGGS